jgi:uncharacterized protein
MSMGFSNKLSESFGRVIEKSPYSTTDPIVKVNFTEKGKNLVFGRALRDEDYSRLFYVGKVYETASGKSYLGCDAWLDATFPHVIYITGTRGSGKSFDLGVILEGISSLDAASPVQNEIDPITSILIDTQSQFWTLRYAPRDTIAENQSQIEDLDRWNIPPNSLSNCKLYIPKGTEKILGDEVVFQIRPRDVTHEEWCSLLAQDVYGPQGHVLAETCDALAGADFSIDDMLTYINTDTNWANIAENTRSAVAYKLKDYDRSGLFDPHGIQVEDLLTPGVCNIFMLRDLRNEDKALITSLIARKLFTIMGKHHQRRKVDKFFAKNEYTSSLPSHVWLLIDEAHVVAPREGSSPARAALVEYVKRGRDAGLSLVLATQQPSAIDDRILSQVNLTFNHRLTFQADISAAVNRIPTKVLSHLKISGSTVSDFGDMLRYLEAGQCFIGDHSTSRTVMVQVRPRLTSHGGYSPV